MRLFGATNDLAGDSPDRLGREMVVAVLAGLAANAPAFGQVGAWVTDAWVAGGTERGVWWAIIFCLPTALDICWNTPLARETAKPIVHTDHQLVFVPSTYYLSPHELHEKAERTVQVCGARAVEAAEAVGSRAHEHAEAICEDEVV